MKNKSNKRYKTMQEFFANKNRWAKGAMEEGEKRCLVGAMGLVHGEYCGPHNVRLRKAISKEKGIPMRELSLLTFNDDPKTTIEDIRKVCKAANV